MKYYSIGEFSERVGITQQTLRNWDSCRLQGKRANKAKKMIRELVDDDNS